MRLIGESHSIVANCSLCSLLLAGCAGYQVGTDSLYAPDVATVYVPMIESDSYRRDLGERLTEAVDQGDRAQDAVQSRRHARRRQHPLGPAAGRHAATCWSRTRSTIRGFRKPSCGPR